MSYVVEVNEAKFFATADSAEWWSLWRMRAEQAGRIAVITASLGGDRVHVAVDDREHADWLAAFFNERVNKCARRVEVGAS